ncbi:RNA polymerase sigma factor SigM [Nocardioides ultimimeridianus]
MSEPGRTDAELLAAHVAGEPDAFGELFGRHRDRLWAVAVRTTGDAELAADGLQEGMIAAFRRADSFRGDAQVTTWLHRIVVNACLDLLRRRAVRRTEQLPDELDDLGDRGSLQTVADTLDPAETAVRRERAELVHAALRLLPDEQRAAVVLVDMEGYPVAEVAAMLDCAVGTVKSRCSRARARLSGLLTELLDTDPGTESSLTPAPGNPPASSYVGSETPRGPPTPPAD